MVTSTDSDVYEKKLHLVRDLKVGAIHVFGGSEPMPAALLNPNYPSGGSAAARATRSRRRRSSTGCSRRRPSRC